LVEATKRRETPEPRRPFTERENEVLQGVFEGLSNKEIGARLDISESSVKAALQQLFQKTGVRTRSQLVRIALEEHLGRRN
jgi:DNA-binding NarL/FixJ family response regulator